MSFFFKENENVVPNNRQRIEFECNLESRQCAAISEKTGTRCKRQTRAMLPYCWQHTRTKYGVKTGISKIPNSGKGLFATKEFKANNKIVPYTGETVTSAILNERYGNYTAPYGLTLSKKGDRYSDPACSRGIGAYANHKNISSINASLSTYQGQNGFIKAKKRIKPGDEIYVNYGRDYAFDEPVQFGTRSRPKKSLEK